MKRLIRILFKAKPSKNKGLEYKVDLLRKAGLNVCAIDKNEKYKDGYILGKMNDRHLVSEIY